jgi:hypothetical protein
MGAVIPQWGDELPKSKMDANKYRKPTVSQILWRWNLRPLERLLALYIRTTKNPDGYFKANINEFEKWTNAKYETVINAIKRMQKIAVLEVHPGKGKKDKDSYRLHNSSMVHESLAKQKSTFPSKTINSSQNQG